MGNDESVKNQLMWRDDRAILKKMENHPETILLSTALRSVTTAYYNKKALEDAGGIEKIITNHDAAIKSTGSLIAKALETGGLAMKNEYSHFHIDGIERIRLISKLETMSAENNFHSLVEIDSMEYSLNTKDLISFMYQFVSPDDADFIGGLWGYLYQKLSPDLYSQDDSVSNIKGKDEGVAAWKKQAWEIGKEVLKKSPHYSVEKIAVAVYKEMNRLYKDGAKDMTGRGGKIPSADTIKRHALTGIKN